jgi:hypothetical protein
MTHAFLVDGQDRRMGAHSETTINRNSNRLRLQLTECLYALNTTTGILVDRYNNEFELSDTDNGGSDQHHLK